MFHRLYSYRNTVGCVMLLLSQTVRLEFALFHCSCMKGAVSHEPLIPADIPAGTTEGCQRTASFTPLPGETTDTPALFHLEAELDAAWRGGCPWRVMGTRGLSRPHCCS